MDKEFIAVLSIFVIFCVLLFVGAYFAEKAVCYRKAAAFTKAEYYFLGGCIVEHNGETWPLENVRAIDDD